MIANQDLKATQASPEVTIPKPHSAVRGDADIVAAGLQSAARDRDVIELRLPEMWPINEALIKDRGPSCCILLLLCVLLLLLSSSFTRRSFLPL